EFYFSSVGHIDENNQYVITNPELLKERVDNGDSNAEKLYNAYLSRQDLENGLLSRGYVDYGTCVLKSYLGPIYDLMDGKYAKALAEQMMSDSWKAAGKILKMALKDASKIAGKTVGGAFAIGELAYYAYQCRGEF
ncbi:hypothetical protein, partial [Clostridium sp. ZBS13]|uniref:hypothetical protein n=1 Tax=Clostridium sp. ZBS13 TaxID=2949971 RepID=UPI00207A59FC